MSANFNNLPLLRTIQDWQQFVSTLNQTPLQKAILLGDLTTAKTMLDAIEDKKARDEQLNQPLAPSEYNVLFFAPELFRGNKQREIIKFLLDNGIEITTKNYNNILTHRFIVQGLVKAFNEDSRMPITGEVKEWYDLLLCFLQQQVPSVNYFWGSIPEPLIEYMLTTHKLPKPWLDHCFNENFDMLEGTAITDLMQAGATMNGQKLEKLLHATWGQATKVPRFCHVISYVAHKCPQLLIEEYHTIYHGGIKKLVVETLIDEIKSMFDRWSKPAIRQHLAHMREVISAVRQAYEILFSQGKLHADSIVTRCHTALNNILDLHAQVEKACNDHYVGQLQYFTKVAHSHPEIQSFDTTSYQTNEFDKIIVASLQQNTSIKKLIVDTVDIDLLSDIFPRNKTISTLVISVTTETTVELEQVKILAELLKNTTNIKSVMVNDECFSDLNAYKILLSIPTIESFYFSVEQDGSFDDDEHENWENVCKNSVVRILGCYPNYVSTLIECLHGLANNRAIKVFRPIIGRSMLYAYSDDESRRLKNKNCEALTNAFCHFIESNQTVEELGIAFTDPAEDIDENNFLNEDNIRKIFNALAKNLNITTIGYVETTAYRNVLVNFLEENMHITRVTYQDKVKEQEDNYGPIIEFEDRKQTLENKELMEKVTKLLNRNRQCTSLLSSLKIALQISQASFSTSSASSSSMASQLKFDNVIDSIFNEAQRLDEAGHKDIYWRLAKFFEYWFHNDLSLAIRAYNRVGGNDIDLYRKAQTQLVHLKLAGNTEKRKPSSVAMSIDDDVEMMPAEDNAQFNSSQHLLEAVRHAFNAQLGQDIDKKQDADKKTSQDNVAMDCSSDYSSDYSDLSSVAIRKFMSNGVMGQENEMAKAIKPDARSVVLLLQEYVKLKNKNAVELKRLREQLQAKEPAGLVGHRRKWEDISLDENEKQQNNSATAKPSASKKPKRSHSASR